MSGNPFRRAPSHHVAAISTSGPGTAATYEQSSDQQSPGSYANVTPTRPRAESKTKKTVRIRSPEFSPIAPDYTRTSPLPDYRNAVPPPPPTAFRNTSPAPPEAPEETSVDHFESRFPPAQNLDRDGEDDKLLQNTRRNSGHPEVAEAAKAITPQNPFTKTLATMEAGIASVVPQPQDKLKLAKLDDAVPPGASKMAMDVDSFTRMLLTGKTDSPKAEGGILNSSLVVDSSSSTDVSSLSRQSMFDTLQGPSAESPRTSFDELSNVADDDDDDNEYAGPASPDSSAASSAKTRKAPPPPKHRHGKSVSSKGPQTVSFDDFTASLTQDLPSATLKHTPDGLNKPLPSMPESTSPDLSTAAGLHRENTPTQASVAALAEPAEVPARSTSQKKLPPPVPLARRQSQMKAQGQNRSRSNSALTTGSQEGSSYPPSVAESTASSKVPPPPPPARRHGNHGSAQPTADFTGSTAPRSALTQALASSRRSSHSNLSNSPPAPPPPRRRRSSGRNSLDTTRNSGDFGRESFDSTRRSMDSANALSTPMEELPQSDVLADMDAFQREIDDLRKVRDNR